MFHRIPFSCRAFMSAGFVLMLAPIVQSVRAAAETPAIAAVAGSVARSTNLGQIEPSSPLRLTVWLNMRNRVEFDQRVEAIYTPGSPTFHKWLSVSDLLSYAPTAPEVQQVKGQLESEGLSVSVDTANPFALRVSGTADKVQAAFHTEIDSFERNGSKFHANVTEAHLSGEAASLIRSVGGLNNIQMQPQIVLAANPKTGKPLATLPLGSVMNTNGRLSAYFTNNCFHTAEPFTFGTPGQLPIGIYFGNVYSQAGKSCAYTAKQMQAAYGLPAAYAEGITGTGQTIVMIVGYGSSTIESDANNFNVLNALPPLNGSNFHMVYSDGPPYDPALGEQWLQETALDVEWAHAIAPGAKLMLVAAPSGEDQDLEYAIQYAVLHKLGGVISGSFGIPEMELSAGDVDGYNDVIEQAAAAGISVNFSSGDRSDLAQGTPVGATVTPADSPYATAVGGTSLGVPGGTGDAKEVGWGNNQTYIAFAQSVVSDPPFNYGTVGGAGGGTSLYFNKPRWQASLPGVNRLNPDVAMEADPYTGAVVMYTDPIEGQVVEAVGGTSLSAPMFSAMWALANEKAGHLLGQAAPILGKLSQEALHDIVPATSPTNVSGTVIDSTGANYFSPSTLAEPLQGASTFTSAIWPIEGEFIDLTFGTDGSLLTTVGWDDVTGYGSPAGYAFITEAAKF